MVVMGGVNGVNDGSELPIDLDDPSVREQLIEHMLVQIRHKGFNGFSYRDLGKLVGVKTSDIHYYFAPECRSRPRSGAMGGADTESLFTIRRMDDFVPKSHPLRPIRTMVNQALVQVWLCRYLENLRRSLRRRPLPCAS